jgi:hypothetical protein
MKMRWYAVCTLLAAMNVNAGDSVFAPPNVIVSPTLIGSSSDTGVSGVMKPLANKTVSCTIIYGWNRIYAEGKVDASGVPYARVGQGGPTAITWGPWGYVTAILGGGIAPNARATVGPTGLELSFLSTDPVQLYSCSQLFPIT